MGAMIAGVHDAWHFTGHGVARDDNPDRSAIMLAGDQPFARGHEWAGHERGHPAPPRLHERVSGRAPSGITPTGIGGWATQFIEAGAGAFVGAYWSVVDEAAFNFAEKRAL